MLTICAISVTIVLSPGGQSRSPWLLKERSHNEQLNPLPFNDTIYLWRLLNPDSDRVVGQHRLRQQQQYRYDFNDHCSLRNRRGRGQWCGEWNGVGRIFGSSLSGAAQEPIGTDRELSQSDFQQHCWDVVPHVHRHGLLRGGHHADLQRLHLCGFRGPVVGESNPGLLGRLGFGRVSY